MKENQFRIFSYHAVCDDWYGRNGARVMLPYSLTDKKALLLHKNAGFNTLFISYAFQYNAMDEEFKETRLIKVMDLAHEIGLKCVIWEKNLHRLTSRRHSLIDPEKANGETIFASEEELERFVGKCLEEPMKHPAFIGVSTMDEPFGEMLLAYGQTVKAMRKIMPDIYINANISLGYHDFLGAGQDLEMSTLERYRKNLEVYDDTVKPPFIQFGIYPIKHRFEGKEQMNGRQYAPSYLTCCCLGGEYCAEHDRLLSVIMQACEFTAPTAGWGCAKPEEADMYLQANVLMAVGTKTYSYWSYFPVVNTGGEYYDESCTIVDTFGRPNELYYAVEKIHREMQEMAPTLLQFTYQAVDLFTNGTLPKYSEHLTALTAALDEKDLKRIPVGSLTVNVNGNGAVMVTEMANKETGEKGYFVVNAVDPQYRFKADVTLGFNGVKTLKVLREGKTETLLSENEKFNFVLEEGRAVFVIPQK